jgi:hypothetical protein
MDVQEKHGWTTPMVASAHGHKAVVEKLPEKGASLVVQTKGGFHGAAVKDAHGAIMGQ